MGMEMAIRLRERFPFGPYIPLWTGDNNWHLIVTVNAFVVDRIRTTLLLSWRHSTY